MLQSEQQELQHKTLHRSPVLHLIINQTDLLKAFLGNGSANTVNVRQWKTCLSGRMFLAFLGKSARIKTLARNNVTDHFGTKLVLTLNVSAIAISTIYKYFPACCVFTCSCLVAAPTMAIPLLPYSIPLGRAAPFQLRTLATPTKFLFTD
jgi:hypothetical protein